MSNSIIGIGGPFAYHIPSSPPSPPSSPQAAEQKENDAQMQKEEMSKEQIQRREAILNTPFEIRPRLAADLPIFKLNVRRFLEQLALHLKMAKMYYQEPSIAGSFAINLLHSAFPHADLDLEYPVDVKAFHVHSLVKNTGTKGYEKEKHITEKLIDFVIMCLLVEIRKGEGWEKHPKLKSLSRTLTDSSGKYDSEVRNLLALNYLKVIPIKDPLGKTILCHIRIGNEIQINFPFFDKEQILRCRNAVTVIDKCRVGVFENWILYHNLAKRALAEHRCEIPDPNNVHHLLFRAVLFQSKGILPTNAQEVAAAVLRNIQSEYDVKVVYERSRPVNKPLFGTAYEEYQQSHFPDNTLDQMIDFMNWVDLLLKLPEGVSSQYYQSIAQKVAHRNPLAALIKDKPFEMTRDVIDFLHGILFVEWMQENPLTQGYEVVTPQLTLTQERTPHYVTLGKTPAQLIMRLARSWVALEQAGDKKREDSLTGILGALKCTKITFSKEDRKAVFEGVVNAVIRGPLARCIQQGSQDPNEIYRAVQGVVDEKFLQMRILQHQLLPALKGMREEGAGKEEKAILKLCENYSQLTPENILEMARKLNDVILEKLRMREALSATLLLLLERGDTQPSLPFLHAVQKLFIILDKKKILSAERCATAIKSLIIQFHLHRQDMRRPAYLVIVSEFLSLSGTFTSKSEELERFKQEQCQSILVIMGELLADLKAPEKEKLAYQCAFALVAALPKELAEKEMPGILTKFVGNAVRTHTNTQLEEYRNRRLQLLVHLSKIATNKEPIELKRYLVQEIAEILRHPLHGTHLKALERFGGILLALEGAQKELQPNSLQEKAPLVRFMKSYINIASTCEPSIAEEMLNVLNRMHPGAAKLNALKMIQRALKLRTEESTRKALTLYHAFVETEIESNLAKHPHTAFLQASILIHFMVLRQAYPKMFGDDFVLNLSRQLERTLELGQAGIQHMLSKLPEQEPKLLADTLFHTLKSFFRSSLGKPAAFSLLSKASFLLNPEQIRLLQFAILEFDKVDADTACTLLCQLFESCDINGQARDFLESTCLSLLEKLFQDKAERQVERIFIFLKDRNYLDKFNHETQFKVYFLLFSMNLRALFTQAWRALPDDHVLKKKYGAKFALHFSKSRDAEYAQMVYQLFEKSGKQELVYYFFYLDGISELKYEKKMLTKMISDGKAILTVKDTEGNVKESAGEEAIPPTGYFKAQILQFIFRYAYEISNTAKPAEKTKIAKDLAPFIVPTQTYMHAQVEGMLPEVNDLIFNTCRHSDDEEIVVQMGNLCLSGKCKRNGDNAVIFFYEIVTRQSSTTQMRTLARKVMEKAITQNWIPKGKEEEGRLRTLLSCALNFPTIKQVNVAFKVLNVLLKETSQVDLKEREAKEAAMTCVVSKKAPPFSHYLISIAQAFARFKSYKKVAEIGLLARKLQVGANWRQGFLAIVNALLDPIKHYDNPRDIRSSVEHFEVLFPLLCELSPTEARGSVTFISTILWKYRKEPWQPALVERLLALVSKTNVYSTHPNDRVHLANVYICAMCCDPKQEGFEKAVNLFCQLTEQMHFPREFLETFPKLWVDAALTLNQGALLGAMGSKQEFSNLRFLKVAFPKISPHKLYQFNYFRMAVLQVLFCLQMKNDYVNFRAQEGAAFNKASNRAFITSKLKQISNLARFYSAGILGSPHQAAQLKPIFEIISSSLVEFSEAQWDQLFHPDSEATLVRLLVNIFEAYYSVLPQKGNEERFPMLAVQQQQSIDTIIRNLQPIMTKNAFDKVSVQLVNMTTSWMQRLCKAMEAANFPQPHAEILEFDEKSGKADASTDMGNPHNLKPVALTHREMVTVVGQPAFQHAMEHYFASRYDGRKHIPFMILNPGSPPTRGHLKVECEREPSKLVPEQTPPSGPKNS